jgi:hypothetical protein
MPHDSEHIRDRHYDLCALGVCFGAGVRTPQSQGCKASLSERIAALR